MRHPNYDSNGDTDTDESMSEVYCEKRGSIRVLLSAFMISLHHGCVFLSPYDKVQRDLIRDSVCLVERLERVALSLLEHQTFNRVPFELTCDFLPLLANFINHFWEWSIPDKARIERSIQEELVELEEDSLARAYYHHYYFVINNNDNDIIIDQKNDDSSGGGFGGSNTTTTTTTTTSVIEGINARIQQQREKLIQISGRGALKKYDEVRMRFKRNNNDAFNNIMCLDPEMDDFHCPSAEGLAHELLLDPSFQFKEPENACDGDFVVKMSNNNIFSGSSSSDKRVQVVFFCFVVVLLLLIIIINIIIIRIIIIIHAFFPVFRLSGVD